MNSRLFKSAVLALALAASAPAATAAELAVAAASNFSYALDELVAAFHAAHPDVKVNVSYGSSGNFYAQLQAGAPYDIFLSADMRYPERLAAAGYALGGKVFAYAQGRIVVWVPNASPVDVSSLGMRSLLAPAVHKIAIANPELAPYGAAALAALKSFAVYRQAKPRLILGENIAQTAQFVESGAADVGILAMSLALGPHMRASGHFWAIPQEAYPAIEQGGIILKRTANASAARTLRDFMQTHEGRLILDRFGYALPTGRGDGSWTGKPSG